LESCYMMKTLFKFTAFNLSKKQGVKIAKAD